MPKVGAEMELQTLAEVKHNFNFLFESELL